MTKNNSNPELTDVAGIGPARAKKLKKAGVKSPKQLARLKPTTVAKKADIATTRAKKLVSAAKKVADTTSKTTKKKSSKKTSKTTKSKKKASKPKHTKKGDKAAQDALKDIIARARDHFKRAPDEHVFILHGGETIKDLRELAEALEQMQEHVFRHHVNDEKHDFAAWVHHVLDEHALAKQLREARKHPEYQGHVIYRHITRRVW